MTERKHPDELERPNRVTGVLLRSYLDCPLCGGKVPRVARYGKRTVRLECQQCDLQFSIDVGRFVRSVSDHAYEIYADEGVTRAADAKRTARYVALAFGEARALAQRRHRGSEAQKDAEYYAERWIDGDDEEWAEWWGERGRLRFRIDPDNEEATSEWAEKGREALERVRRQRAGGDRDNDSGAE